MAGGGPQGRALRAFGIVAYFPPATGLFLRCNPRQRWHMTVKLSGMPTVISTARAMFPSVHRMRYEFTAPQYGHTVSKIGSGASTFRSHPMPTDRLPLRPTP